MTMFNISSNIHYLVIASVNPPSRIVLLGFLWGSSALFHKYVLLPQFKKELKLNLR